MHLKLHQILLGRMRWAEYAARMRNEKVKQNVGRETRREETTQKN